LPDSTEALQRTSVDNRFLSLSDPNVTVNGIFDETVIVLCRSLTGRNGQGTLFSRFALLIQRLQSALANTRLFREACSDNVTNS